MTSPLDAPLKPDPKRPYKAYAAALAAAIATLLGLGLHLPEWVTVVGTMVLAGLSAYLKKNPHIPAHRR